MFCNKCGKPIEEGQTICPECAALEAQDTFELNQPVGKKTKKRNWKLPVILSSVVLLLAAAAVLVWGFFISGTFLPAQNYMMKVEKKAVSESLSSVGKVYGTFMSAKPSENELKMGAKADMHLLLGEEVIEMIESYAAERGEDADLSFLSDIAIDLETAMEGKFTLMNMGIGLNNKSVLTMSMLTNAQDMEMYFGLPELSDTFMKIKPEMPDNSGYPGAAVVPTVDYEEILEIVEQMQEVLPSEETFTALLEKYILLVLEQIEDAEKETETVKVGDAEQKLNVITVKLSEKDALKIAKAVLKEAKGDKDLKKILQDIGDYAEEVGSDAIDEDLYDSFKAGIESALESIDYAMEDASNKATLEIKTYVNNQMEIVGRSIKEKESGMKVSYITVWQGKKFGFEAKLADQIEIKGEGTKNKGVISGEYELVVNDEEMLTVEVSDYDEKKAEEGYPTGTLLIKPSEELLDSALGSASSVASLLLDDLAVELKFNTSETKADTSIKLLTGDKLLFGITASMENKEIAVEEPEKYITVNGEADLEQWAQNIDLDSLLQKLEDAGVPVDLVKNLFPAEAA